MIRLWKSSTHPYTFNGPCLYINLQRHFVKAVRYRCPFLDYFHICIFLDCSLSHTWRLRASFFSCQIFFFYMLHFYYLISCQHNQTHFDVCTPQNYYWWAKKNQKKKIYNRRLHGLEHILVFWLNLKSRFGFFFFWYFPWMNKAKHPTNWMRKNSIFHLAVCFVRFATFSLDILWVIKI